MGRALLPEGAGRFSACVFAKRVEVSGEKFCQGTSCSCTLSASPWVGTRSARPAGGPFAAHPARDPCRCRSGLLITCLQMLTAGDIPIGLILFVPPVLTKARSFIRMFALETYFQYLWGIWIWRSSPHHAPPLSLQAGPAGQMPCKFQTWDY